MRILLAIAALAVAGLLYFFAQGGAPARTQATTRDAAPETASAEPPPSAPEPEPEGHAHVVRLRVVDEDRRPVEGARGSVDEAVAISGADGLLEIPVPGYTRYWVRVQHPGYIAAEVFADADTDAEEVVLEGGAPIVVVVRDGLSKPVTGAKVLALRPQGRGAAGMWYVLGEGFVGEAATDERGRAAIGAAADGDVQVTVSHDAFAVSVTTVSILGPEPVEHIVVLGPGGTIVGTVVDGGGAPVAGAVVRASSRETVSGGDGTFRLEQVGDGAHTILATHPEHGPGFFGANLGWGEPVPVRVAPGEVVSGIELRLTKVTRVRGRVVDANGRGVGGVNMHVGVWPRIGASFEPIVTAEDGSFVTQPLPLLRDGWVSYAFWSPEWKLASASGWKEIEYGADFDLGTFVASPRGTIRGTVIGPDGEPVAGASVRATPIVARSAPDGSFELTGVDPGTAEVEANKDGEPPLVCAAPVSVAVSEGGAAEVVVRLVAAQKIAGRVVTARGEPRRGEAGLAVGDFQSISWTSGEDGAFSVYVPPGVYRVGLGARTFDFDTDTRQDEWREDVPTITVEGERTDLEFVVPVAGASLFGEVVSRRTGARVESFSVTAIRTRFFIPQDTETESHENADGRFRIDVDEPGTWVVEVSADGHAPYRTEPFSVEKGESVDLGTIRLGDGGAIHGTVTDSNGAPVPYTRINVLSPKLETNPQEPFTDSRGRYEVTGLAPGVYNVFAVSPTHPLGILKGVDVREGGRTRADVTLRLPAPVTVVVKDPQGAPVEGATVDYTFEAVAPLNSSHFRNKEPPGYGGHETGADGTLRKPSLPPGPVTFLVSREGFRSTQRTLTLEPGKENLLPITLHPE